ncbi:DUF6241 domain-containing protein [Bacillus sp. USDA818B3_A]|uniref:DUF6241 domain-containing protein n=1 Tax=Bacillus sp. USDA818B3_A TaxID=2698834 RepID=UPI00137130A4|nr:DUF6241 domain-containing protein [Bacillus sp. USDA818B3_A]
MKNKLTIVIVVTAIVLGFAMYFSTSFIGTKEVIGPSKTEEKKVVAEPVTTAAEGNEEKEKIGPELEEELPLDLSEEEIQNKIHAMSHAKVHAEEKWTHLEPTQERINRLLVVVESNQDGLNESNLYIAILKRWKAGDFSKAVSDHNKIWKLQDGTIGEATRLLSDKEQAEYREDYFE